MIHRRTSCWRTTLYRGIDSAMTTGAQSTPRPNASQHGVRPKIRTNTMQAFMSEVPTTNRTERLTEQDRCTHGAWFSEGFWPMPLAHHFDPSETEQRFIGEQF